MIATGHKDDSLMRGAMLRKGKEERGERKKICKRRSKLCVRKQQKDEWRREAKRMMIPLFTVLSK